MVHVKAELPIALLTAYLTLCVVVDRMGISLGHVALQKFAAKMVHARLYAPQQDKVLLAHVGAEMVR